MSHLCSLALPLPWSTPLPRWSVIRDHALARLGAFPRAALALALPRPVYHMWAGLGKGDVMPARDLVRPGLGKGDVMPARGLMRPVLRVTLFLHDPFPFSWTSALSPGLIPLPLCPRAVSAVPVGAIGFAHALGVTIHGLNERTRALRTSAGSTVIVCDHTVPTIGPVTIRTSPDQGRKVGCQGGVAGIVQRLMVPPRIAATIGYGWSLLLRLRAAPEILQPKPSL